MKAIYSILFFAVFFTFSNAQETQIPVNKKNLSPENRYVKNIILMIGDGMGISQIYAGMTANHGHLNLERIQNIGLIKTYSANDYITDSGAAATALATGKKTFDGAIGVDADSAAVTSILEHAEFNNKATGIVVTCAVTHATPAAFIAHQTSRKKYEEIASDFLKTDIDVFFGGGLNHFKSRKDNLDLTQILADKGYQMIYSIDSIRYASGPKVAGLLYPEHPPKYSDGRGELLSMASLKAIEILNKNPNGFFLMIEGSQIDWGGHDNDTQYIINEVLDFDRTLGEVIKFVEKDGNTLLIVTADHETGGMGLVGGNFATGEVKAGYTTGDHTGVMVPVFAFGKDSENFRGIYENAELFNKMMTAYGFLNPGRNNEMKTPQPIK